MSHGFYATPSRYVTVERAASFGWVWTTHDAIPYLYSPKGIGLRRHSGWCLTERGAMRKGRRAAKWLTNYERDRHHHLRTQ